MSGEAEGTSIGTLLKNVGTIVGTSGRVIRISPECVQVPSAVSPTRQSRPPLSHALNAVGLLA